MCKLRMSLVCGGMEVSLFGVGGIGFNCKPSETL